jgi:Tol biopolymer transport system component/DNA-binding winged helix-turn-helix (wHTH) protein
LAQQSFRVLRVFLEKPGQLVTREELRARLWPAGTLVEYDQGLNTAVNRLREALGDSAEAPRFIETLPKRGYRFIAAIQPHFDAHQPSPSPSAAVAPDPAHAVPVDSDQVNSGVAADSLIHVRGARLHRRNVLAAAAVFAAVLFIAGLMFLSRRHSVVPLSVRQVVPFTSLPGKEIAPTFSPDGSEIAFGWNGGAAAGRHFDLYVKSLGSERLLQLTHQPAAWINPAWSPDGSSIAFVRQTDNGAGIFVIPALGGSERSIVSEAVGVGPSVQVSWSPDGQQLAYSGYGPRGSAQVYILSLDSLKAQPLVPAPECVAADQPAFSPDGSQLALICISDTAVYAIYVVRLPHGPLRRIASMMGYPAGLAWTADGKRLIFSNDPGDGGELWQVSMNGELTQLPFGEEGTAPAVAPKGGRIAYVRGRGTLDIWRADLTTAHPEESVVRLISSTRAQERPSYSPDGTRIAFQSNRSGATEIWLTDAQGAEAERITSFNGPYTSSPRWCSDGHRIAFDSRAPGVSAIYVEDIAERVPRKVLTSRSSLASPAWSQDCRWLFAIETRDGDTALYRFPSGGGPAERFTARQSNYVVVVGDRVLFNGMRADGVVLWSKPVSGGPESPLENMPRLTYGDAWVATTNGIYYSDLQAKPLTINFYDFATHTRRTLMTLKHTTPPFGPGLAISPDGRWLLYGQFENEQSEIMLAPVLQ